MDLIGGQQGLTGRRRRGAVPIGVENLVFRTQVRCRIAVTRQAPTHVQRGRFPRHGHVADRPMAFRAAHALGDVNAVIEKDVIGQGINARPADRHVVCQALTVRREHGCVGPDLGMARHANRRRWHSGAGGFLDRSVTIAAIESETADVVLVAERNGLLWRKTFLCVVSDHRNDPDRQNQTDN